jgi:hypothetical protein
MIMTIGTISMIKFTAIFNTTIPKKHHPAVYLMVASGTNSVKMNAKSKHTSKHMSLNACKNLISLDSMGFT